MHGMESSVRAANLAALTLLTSLVFLAGCGLSSNPADGTTTTSLSIRGQVHGGAQPVKGSTITLNAASLSGYCNASTVLTMTNSDASATSVSRVPTPVQPAARFTLQRPAAIPGRASTTRSSRLQRVLAPARVRSRRPCLSI